MNYFLSGGAKNGKSSLAQEIVCAQSGPRYYLATMIPHDDEDRLRIQRHLDNRAGMGFQTVECGTDILSSLSRMEPASGAGTAPLAVYFWRVRSMLPLICGSLA